MPRPFELAADPRTVARDVSGIFEATFPQLAPALVSYFNRVFSRKIHNCQAIPVNILNNSSLQRAMLFELALAVAEQWLVNPGETDWVACLHIAVARQQRYFDAEIPNALLEIDKEIVSLVATNLRSGLLEISAGEGAAITVQPRIPGFRWIATGLGDFAAGTVIIEVKCSSRRFSTADYRQIVMYWLLSYVKALETGRTPWRKGVLLNPRLNSIVEFSFDEIVPLIAFGRSVSSVVEAFHSIIGEDPGLELG